MSGLQPAYCSENRFNLGVTDSDTSNFSLDVSSMRGKAEKAVPRVSVQARRRGLKRRKDPNHSRTQEPV